MGGAGNDRLAGGAGRDVLLGGEGNDVFRLRFGAQNGNSTTSADLILDFINGDLIDLVAMDASQSLSGNNTFQWNGMGPMTTAKNGELRFQQFDFSRETTMTTR